MVCNAQFRARSPPRSSGCLTVHPLPASTGPTNNSGERSPSGPIDDSCIAACRLVRELPLATFNNKDYADFVEHESSNSSNGAGPSRRDASAPFRRARCSRHPWPAVGRRRRSPLRSSDSINRQIADQRAWSGHADPHRDGGGRRTRATSDGMGHPRGMRRCRRLELTRLRGHLVAAA